jgi:hypothetical protein
MELALGMLSVQLVEVGDGWLWRSGMIDSMPEVGLGCFGVFVVDKVKDRIVSIAGGLESTAWRDFLLWVVVVVKVEWVLAPFSTWFQQKWGNLCFGGWFHCRGTCSIGVSLCMGLNCDRGHDLELHSFGCMGRSLIEGPWVSFLRRWSVILLPVPWWPATIRIDVMHRLGVDALIIIVMGSCSFIWFRNFPLLLELAKMLDL